MSYYRPEGPQALTPMVRNLLIINVAIFVVSIVSQQAGDAIERYGALYFPGSERFFVTQFITYMFLHSRQGFFHILFNMFGLYMFGTAVERVWGWKRFLNYYLACGLGAAVVYVLTMYLPIEANVNKEMVKMVGASGAIYGLLAAFGFLYPNNKVYVYFVIPMKAKYFVALLIAVDLLFGFSGADSGVAHFAHVGGAATGLIYLFNAKLRRKH
jgi:membrane associated rhomboid family serine protease